MAHDTTEYFSVCAYVETRNIPNDNGEKMRQTKTSTEGKGAKVCTACGAKLWIWDAMMLRRSGPWHFQDCPSVPGGAELTVANIEERVRWLEEKRVSKEQGARIMVAIGKMLDKKKSRGEMLATKTAILEEVGKL